MAFLTYKDAGVDVHKADRAIKGLRQKIESTFTPLVLNPLGGFAALTELPKDYRNPVLVSSTDGVGTKLKVAFLADRHGTVGIDLVAMSANDILTLGAKPLFFLDYFACGRIIERVYQDVISGICEGCKMAGCALVGGETAEMPSFYKDGEYDLAGFVVGVVEKEKIVDGSGIQEGDVIIALNSNGLHSNGYSLARKVFFELRALKVDELLPGLNTRLDEELLKPTRIYVRSVLRCLEEFRIKGMAHITGGGLPGNIERIIPDGLVAKLDLHAGRVPEIFSLIMKLGSVPIEEMCTTFNMGVGYILVADNRDKEGILTTLQSMGETPFLFGVIDKSSGDEKVRISFDGF
jgi:phosphoribosylformylglycinamidine cyclo-ligase